MRFLKRLFNKLFRRDPAKPSREYSSHGNPGKEFKANWGIVIPHTNKAPGANNGKQGIHKISEYDYALKMFDGKESPDVNFPYETRDIGGVSGATRRLVKRGITAVLEPHKNAYNQRVDYFLLLVLRNDQMSIEAAERIVSAFTKEFPNRRLGNGNGIRELSENDRGGSNIADGKRAGADIYILSESFFIDCPSAWIKPKQMAQFWKNTLV